MTGIRSLSLSRLLLVGGSMMLVVAIVAAPAKATEAAAQTWPPFVLVAGLLLIGVVAHRDGLFEMLGGWASRFRTHPAVLLIVLLLVVAGVTAVLNLDTAVAFLTPVVILAARNRGLDEEPFLYGTLLMSNAASLLLPGSNLTNLLVLAHEHVAGAVFAARMLPAWIAAVAVTAVFTLTIHHRHLDIGRLQPAPDVIRRPLTWSTLAVVVAAVAVLALRSPAIPVVILGAAVAVEAFGRRGLSVRQIWAAVEPASLAGVFGAAVALGTLARAWDGPSHLMARANGAETAGLGAIASVMVNNLPAAVLLGSRQLPHPRALLLGLNLGPNLAVTGSLSALIWIRASHTVGARPSAARLSRLGAVLVPLSLATSAVALRLFAPARL